MSTISVGLASTAAAAPDSSCFSSSRRLLDGRRRDLGDRVRLRAQRDRRVVQDAVVPAQQLDAERAGDGLDPAHVRGASTSPA